MRAKCIIGLLALVSLALIGAPWCGSEEADGMDLRKLACETHFGGYPGIDEPCGVCQRCPP